MKQKIYLWTKNQYKNSHFRAITENASDARFFVDNIITVEPEISSPISIYMGHRVYLCKCSNSGNFDCWFYNSMKSYRLIENKCELNKLNSVLMKEINIHSFLEIEWVLWVFIEFWRKKLLTCRFLQLNIKFPLFHVLLFFTKTWIFW